MNCLIIAQSGGQTQTANAPSQAHLQGTQNPYTKANLAKEPALFQRFRDTPYLVGHIHSVRHTKTKGEHTTVGFLLCWLTNISSSFYRYHLRLGLTE